MTALRALILARWFLTFVGTALLALLFWFFGPFLAIFEGWGIRLAVIVVMLALWAGINLALDLHRARRDAALAKGVTETAPDPATIASAEEAAALQEKLTSALALLKRARGTAGYLYEQPWYVIIGPPGAGKTTALLNAGLRFPLASEMGQGVVAGVGGTRLCEWLFTEDAVLIDTAGRYTTQDSDAVVDRAGWQAFLDLLKRTRTRQPLNGVIVAIALTEIGAASRDERLADARTVRRRIKELEERLAVRLPVYVVFTKADLVAGFTEFFDDLDREKRGQVWGATFPFAQSETGAVGGFAPEFHSLIERLNTRLFDRLQAERSPDRRVLIAGFPTQVASLEAPLVEFLQEAFAGSRLDPAPMLRGFYFTSGTQLGTPFDRLTSSLARSFGIDQRRAPTLRPTEGRSYFLARLVKEVIFDEAMLVSEKPGAANRRLLVRGGAFAAVALAVLVIGGLLWHADAANRREMREMDDALVAYLKTASALPLDPVADADLPRILPLLDQARALPHGYDRASHDGLAWLELGLSQRAELAAGAGTVYRHALERVLLPRLIWRLEAQMHGAIDQPDYLYEATRVYLMLGAEGPLDRDLVSWWMLRDWQATYTGASRAKLREDLGRHLEALLAEPLPPERSILLDGALLEKARATFSSVKPASRVYSRIAPSTEARALATWRPADALGAAGVRVFVRASGKPLTEGVPGFYTIDGFYNVLLPALGDVTKQVASESWVLGETAKIAPDSAAAQQLEREVIRLYETDYAERWDKMLADLNLVPLLTPDQAATDLSFLGSPRSPIRDLLVSIARQLTLSQPPPPSPTDKLNSLDEGAVQKAVPAGLARLQSMLPSAGPPPPPPGKEVDDRYKALRDYIGTGPGAPIDQALKAIDGLHQQLAKLTTPTLSGAQPAPAAPSGDDPVRRLREEAAQAPQPVARWLEALASGGNALITGRTRQQAADAFNAPGGPASWCQKAVTGRYPFVAGASDDIPLNDFAKLFAPGGLLDGFFNTQLQLYTDTSGANWAPRPVNGVPAPIAPADLLQFQRAAVIRDLFFGSGDKAPMVRFDITPVLLDNDAKQVTLDLGGTPVTYAHGPQRASSVTWPGPNGMSSARLVFDPPPLSGPGVLQASGPWALFRLFEQGRLKQSGSADRYELTFPSGERQAVFEIRAGSVQNPFTPGLLRSFQCPKL